MHFVFTPPGESAAGLLDLPWTVPLAEWDDARLVEIRQRGLSRHTVRFVAEGGAVYALKELDARLARREYRLLRELRSLGLPAVEVIGVVVDRPDQDAILVTRFLDHSSSYRALFANARYAHPTDRLLDALVELLVRLHLAGFMWGDCSLSNVLFRLDAGAFAAYLVDAETAELHPSLSEGQRDYDVSLARERIAGELFDLAAAGTLPDDVDPIDVADDTVRRYQGLWDELTREEILHPADQRYRIAERLRRINSLGFDVDEVELVDVRSTEGAPGGVGGRPPSEGPPEGARLRVRTRVAEPGHHRRILMARTGLDAQENQARRLLNDIAAFRGHLERLHGGPVPEVVASNQWLAEVYEPVIKAIPPDLRDRLDDVELFHEVLEHRWYLSERSGRDVGTSTAAQDYFASVLPAVPPDLTESGRPPDTTS
ncbi:MULTISPECIES: DUF4032 domain-containing protein [Actinomadura]|uniref:Lipopolysaccharide kinase (Kdo/WaaP) family protein n=2 Tax=Actinomadura madurae TaxID=1993 RepID=A0A1I5U8D6_9ACTN|nr:DUF4032 domain-containing protein [Actinomadura madurae]SFP91502.1 Lipopolysaccharide kinase (Kdo/WaaP) family protein [Actinomadura madurae]